MATWRGFFVGADFFSEVLFFESDMNSDNLAVDRDRCKNELIDGLVYSVWPLQN